MDTRPQVDILEKVQTKIKLDTEYHVILLDDDHHTYEYVIEMLGDVFGYGKADAFELACEVDAAGWVVVFTSSYNKALVKRNAIHNYGADWRMKECKGSMSAIVERADKFD